MIDVDFGHEKRKNLEISASMATMFSPEDGYALTNETADD